MEENTKSIELPWTGERYVPGVEGNIELEHVHRYLIACELVKDREVLDIASGEGYGSAILAEVARSVVGVDISRDAVAHAERKYGKNNLQFRIGSCEEIPLPNACVDVVVSFETIEHHDQHEDMMAEIKRVLRPGGLLIISSPDKYEYSVVPNYSNPYHVKELYRHEFEQLLFAYFKNAVFYGQRVVYGSAIFSDKGPSDILSYKRQDGRLITTGGIPQPVYLIAVASDEEIPKMPSGILEQPINESEIALSLSTERDAALAERNLAMAERDAALAERDTTLAERDAALAERDTALAERDVALAKRNTALVERNSVDARIAELLGSTSWRITAPIRALKHAVLRVRPIIGEWVRALYWGYTTPEVGFNPSARFTDPLKPFEPAVTVIVPNYNHSPFLKQRLDSIYQQSYKSFKVILLDDCSTDNSQAILEEYAQIYPAVTQLHVNTVNSGSVFLQWKKGISLAEGELIWIAESDDYCDENFLETLVPFFRDEAVKLVYSRTVFVGTDGQPLSFTFENYLAELDEEKWRKNYLETTHNEVIKALAKKNSIPNVSSVLFKKPENCSLLQEEEWQNMRICGDWIFYLHLARGGKIAFSKETINYHRYHTSNLSVSTYKSDVYYREHAMVASTVAQLYDVPEDVLQAHFDITRRFWRKNVGVDQKDMNDFLRLYSPLQIKRAAIERRPNILIVGYAFCTGGGEIFPIRLAAALKERGYGVTYFDFHGEPVNPRVRKMLPSDIPVIERNDRLGNIDTLLEQFGIEIVHTHHASSEFYFVTNINRMRKKVKHIVTMHGMYEIEEEITLNSNLPLIMKGVDAWVYISEKNLVPFKERGFYQENMFLKITNGITPPVVKPVNREELGIAPDSFVLCLVSRAIPEKGWLEAIEITTVARTISQKDIHLLLLGDGPVYETLQRESLPTYVHLLGFRENPIDYYAMANVGFLPSRFKGESFPLSVIECLMAGRPVIASDLGEIRDMLTVTEGNVAGRLFPLQNWEVPIREVAQIIADYADDTERYAMAQMLAKKSTARFSMENVVEEYAAVYEKVISGNFLKKLVV